MLDRNTKVIHVGCGAGEQYFYLIDHFHCLSIVGIDSSSYEIERAIWKLKNRRKNHPLKFYAQNIFETALFYQHNKYDRIISLECAYHLSDKKKNYQFAFQV